MKSLRSHLMFPSLNYHNHKLTQLPMRQARIYLDKCLKSPRSPRIKIVADEIVENIPLRIYKNTSGRSAGVIVFFHGGGFSLGSLDSHDQLTRLLAKSTGRTVISVGYSLAPKYKYPAQINEGLKVLENLTTLAEKYSFDPKTISLAGDSAGGFIALHVAHDSPVPIAHAILLYPNIDTNLDTKSMHLYGENYFLTGVQIKKFWEDFIGDKPLPSYTPGWLEKLPPTLFITADYDALRDNARKLYVRLRNVGGTTQYKRFKGMWHGFMHFPYPISSRRKALRLVTQFMDIHKS